MVNRIVNVKSNVVTWFKSFFSDANTGAVEEAGYLSIEKKGTEEVAAARGLGFEIIFAGSDLAAFKRQGNTEKKRIDSNGKK